MAWKTPCEAFSCSLLLLYCSENRWVLYVLGACWCLISSCCLAPFKCVHTGRWRLETQPAWASEQRQNEGCKLVWETSPYNSVSSSWYLCVASPPCRTLHRFFLPSIPLIASSSYSPWNKCYCLQPPNCAWPQYKLLFTTIGYISLCCVICVSVCVVM